MSLTDVSMDSIMLERLKVMSRAALSPQVAHDAELTSHLDAMTQRMVLDLRSHIYADKVDTQDIVVPFSKTETVPVAWRVGEPVAAGLAGAAGLVVAAISLLFGPVALGVAVVAIVGFVWAAHFAKPQSVTVTVTGQAVAHREQFNTFPDNTTVYPKSLGSPVRMATISTDVRYLAP